MIFNVEDYIRNLRQLRSSWDSRQSLSALESIFERGVRALMTEYLVDLGLGIRHPAYVFVISSIDPSLSVGSRGKSWDPTPSSV